MSDTPRTDKLSTFLVTQFPATRGNLELHKHLCELEKCERELNEATAKLDKCVQAEPRQLWNVALFETAKDRDQWKAIAQELFALLEGNHHSDCSIQSPEEPHCDCGYQQGFDAALSRFNELNKGQAFIPPHQTLAVALKRYTAHRETCTRDMHNAECSCGLDALIKQLDELSPQ